MNQIGDALVVVRKDEAQGVGIFVEDVAQRAERIGFEQFDVHADAPFCTLMTGIA